MLHSYLSLLEGQGGDLKRFWSIVGWHHDMDWYGGYYGYTYSNYRQTRLRWFSLQQFTTIL